MDGLLLTFLAYVVGLLIVAWTGGALFYDLGRASAWGKSIALCWLVLSVAALVFWQPVWQPFLALVLIFALFLGWWFSQKPPHHGNWAPGFTELPTIALEGDTLTIDNIRNCDYHGIGECTTRYETRTYRFSSLRGVDALILYWGSSWMCHPMFVFDFGSDGRVCISIEVRYLDGQDYDFFRSIYRQQTLIYVVSDERDAILRRTLYQSGQDLYLYRLKTKPLGMQSFFFEYAHSINSLAEQPRWYNGLTTNCTTSIYAQGRGRMEWDWRMLFNGALDELMYDRQLLDQELPFETLKQRSRINDIANQAPVNGFGEFIRRSLPGFYAPAGGGLEKTDRNEERRA